MVEKRRLYAQSTIEYIVILTVIIAVLMTMNTYAKRGIQAHIKDAALVLGVKQSGETEQEFATRLQKESQPQARFGATGWTNITSTTHSSYTTQAAPGGTQTTNYNQQTGYYGTAATVQNDGTQ